MSVMPDENRLTDGLAMLRDFGFTQQTLNYINAKVAEGLSYDVIVEMIRTGSDSSLGGQEAAKDYKRVFPRLNEIVAKGLISPAQAEGTFYGFKLTMKKLQEQYNLSPTLTSDNRIAEYLLSGNSATEIAERVATAAKASLTIPAEAKVYLQQQYGINSGELISFYLDPDAIEEEINQKVAVSQIAGEAIRQDLALSQAQLERVLRESGGASEYEPSAQALQSVRQAAAQQGLTSGVGETATLDELLSASLGNQEAQRKVQRVAGTRAGRFEQGGGFVEGREGVAGLGSAATM